MDDKCTNTNVAILTVEFEHIKEQLKRGEERIVVLEAHKAKTERYGFIAMGVIAMGAALVAGIDKVATKILSLAH